jgi:hypothetical protein
LGPGRSYRAVADHFGVTKRAITKRASKENWAERLDEVEGESRERLAKKAAETLDAMNERHLKVARYVQGRAIDALRSMQLNTPADVMRALEIGVKQERLVRGEPSDKDSIEAITRRELEDLLNFTDDDDQEEDEPEAG